MNRIAVATIVAFVAFSAARSLDAGDPAKKGEIQVREIKGVRLPADFDKGSVEKPLVVDSAEALDKALAGQDGKEAKEKILKEADFKKDQVLIFGWSGSGGDRLTARVDKATVVFEYTGGLTDDLRRHYNVFAMPKGTKWSVKK